MAKLVNLDELATPERNIKFRGETHKVLDLPLEDFIAFQKDFETLLQEQSKGNVEPMLAAAYSIIQRSVPTFTECKALNLRQLMATVQLIADFYPQVDEGNE